MILSRRIALNDVWLDELDEAIVIRSIDPGTPKQNVQTVNRMGGAGQRMTVRHWESIEATVTFAINLPKTSLKSRRQVFDAVVAWANNTGWLRINYMQDRRLHVDSVVIPSPGDLWEWTDEYTITFRAYNVPFWQSTVVEKEFRGTTVGGITMDVPGNVESVLNATVTNNSGKAISYLKFEVKQSGKTLSNLQLDDIALPANGKVEIAHTNGILTIKKISGNSSESIMNRMNAASSDDLFIRPGTISITFSAERAVIVGFSLRGRYL